MDYRELPPRIRFWILGYYASQVDERKGLEDIQVWNLDKRYLKELVRRADKETFYLRNEDI